MEVLLDSLANEWQGLLRLLPRLALALLAFWLSIVIGRALGRALNRLLQRGSLSVTHKKFLQGAVVWLLGVVGIILFYPFFGKLTKRA